jgi:hypothetical protein
MVKALIREYQAFLQKTRFTPSCPARKNGNAQVKSELTPSAIVTLAVGQVSNLARKLLAGLACPTLVARN